MINEQSTPAPAADPGVRYEYLQVQATVTNSTNQDMTLLGSDLSWGKWIQSPVSTPHGSWSRFSSQGRESSPSGTEGSASWKIGEATIRVTFACPLHGSNSQGITCTPAGQFKVTSQGTGGDVNRIVFVVEPAS